MHQRFSDSKQLQLNSRTEALCFGLATAVMGSYGATSDGVTGLTTFLSSLVVTSLFFESNRFTVAYSFRCHISVFTWVLVKHWHAVRSVAGETLTPSESDYKYVNTTEQSLRRIWTGNVKIQQFLVKKKKSKLFKLNGKLVYSWNHWINTTI